MTKDQAVDAIHARGKEAFQPDKSGKGFVCPICGSGSGENGTGITTKDGVHFTCWRGCFSSADIIDILGLQYGLTDFDSKLQRAAQELNIMIDGSEARPSRGNQNHPVKKHSTQDSIHNTTNTTQQEEEEPDYTDFFELAERDIGKTSYHRGLSDDTLAHFRVGYVAEWRHPKSPKMQPSPRLIIPTGKSSYLARHASETDFIDYQGKVNNKSKVGKVRVFNTEVLKTATNPIFIVEGEIDAMSFYEVGFDAIGLGSIGNWRKLLDLLKEERPTQPLIIVQDKDTDPKAQKAVEAATKSLEEGLDRLGIVHIRADVSGAYKDANAALMADKKAFYAAVVAALDGIEEAKNAELEQLQKESASHSLDGFLRDIEADRAAACIPTGFKSLDGLLDGGLFPGLYIVGAISSLGKTSLCLQIADQIAAFGRDVLIFSMEMARNELIAKSLSRCTYYASTMKHERTDYAKTTRGILSGKYYGEEEKEVFDLALQVYKEHARHIFITEGIGDVGIAQIREKVERHIRITGKAPVVIIDYLQIIAPADMRATDKQNTDKAVLELKRMSRDYKIPVIGISSFNRDNYTAPVNLASFKESGAIEYSSDVLIGLQLDGMDYSEGERDGDRDKRIRTMMKQAAEDAKKGVPQCIQVKVLKNRNGTKGSVLLWFTAMFNVFVETRGGAAAAAAEDGEGWETESSTKRPLK